MCFLQSTFGAVLLNVAAVTNFTIAVIAANTCTQTFEYKIPQLAFLFLRKVFEFFSHFFKENLSTQKLQFARFINELSCYPPGVTRTLKVDNIVVGLLSLVFVLAMCQQVVLAYKLLLACFLRQHRNFISVCV
jgi:hypothetical protein